MPHKRLFALVQIAAACCLAQSTVNIDRVDVTHKPPTTQYVRIAFDQNVKAPLSGTTNAALGNVTLRVLPDEPLSVIEVKAVAFNSKILEVVFAGDPSESATTVRVCFEQLELTAGTIVTARTCGEGEIVRDFAEARDRALTHLQNQVPETSAEKNIFASGFVTTASEGTQGGMDINLNSLDLGVPKLTSFLQIKKTTQEGSDAKNFEAGARYRSVFMTALPDGLVDAIAQSRSDDDPAKRAQARVQINTLQDKMQRSFWAGAIWDFATKLEGEAGDFSVTNAVGESALQFQSMTKRLGTSDHGFWRLRLMPVALEGGRSLSGAESVGGEMMMPDTTAPTEVDWIARLKYSLGLTAYYENADSPLPFKRVEFDANAVNRHLFFEEMMFNDETMMADRMGKGSRGYVQADLKLFVGESDTGRYGLRISYTRGSLPPVFARVQSFQFGFLFESKGSESVEVDMN